MFMQLVGNIDSGKPVSMKEVFHAVESDTAAGMAAQIIVPHDPKEVPWNTVTVSGFKDEAGKLLPHDPQLIITQMPIMPGLAASSFGAARLPKTVVTLVTDQGVIKRWSE